MPALPGTHRHQPLRRRALLGIAAGTLALPRPGLAQAGFPNRPIRLILPWPAGGSADIMGRALAEAASRRLGQPVVVDNKPGAGGVLGLQALLSEGRPDGHTLVQMPTSAITNPLMAARPLFDPLQDFTWIIHVFGYLFVIAVRADAPWQSFPELLADIRANPGKFDYATPGVGSPGHMTMEQLCFQQGLQWQHVPFRGSAEIQPALLSGAIRIAVDTSAGGLAELVRAGRLRLLASMAPARASRYPDVPTFQELGLGLTQVGSGGYGGPKGMDPGLVRRLHDALRDAMNDPAHMATLDRYDMQAVYMNTEDYTAFAHRLHAQNKAVIERLGLRLG